MGFPIIILVIIICLNYIHLQEESEFNITITKIISKNISSGGYLFLETDGILIHSTSFNQENIFDLSIISDEDKSIFSLLCFFYKYERFIGPAMIACEINSQKKGKYHLKSLENTKSFLFSEIYIVNILPFNFGESFNIIEGYEFYFYTLKKNSLDFYNNVETKTIKFEFYAQISKEITFYLEDIPITCEASRSKMICPISAKDFPQDNRFQSLNVYIKDSQGNKKKNYFVYPIEIILNYIEKKTLKIKVSKTLTKCLTDNDFIVFDTSDNFLENVIFSKEGFYLKIKKENDDSDIKQLICGFHKHPGETTKILCKKQENLEDGFYYFEEYISEGPLEDEDNRISPNYNIIIPTFKSNSKFIYSSKIRDDERIYDTQLRDKIELSFRNKNEILNITLNHEYYEGKNKYFLGNSQIKCSIIDNDFITCGIQGISFENSGIYYIEKMNFLGEKERLHILPPVLVTLLWDK